MRVNKSGLYQDYPAIKLLDSIISYEGLTSADGNVGGTTLVCAGLTNEPSYANLPVKILTGPAAGQIQRIASAVAGTVTVAAGFTNAIGAAQQITAGTAFIILSASLTDVAAIIAILAAHNAVVSVAGSPYSQPDDLVEHDVILIPAATQLISIEMDMSSLTQKNSIREYAQVDGANYRLVSAKLYPDNFDIGTKAVLLEYAQKASAYKVTMQAEGIEGAARDVPYRIMTRNLV